MEVQEERRFIIQYFIIWQLKYEGDSIDQDSHDLPLRKRLTLNSVISRKKIKLTSVLKKDLWEVRTRLENSIARVFFTVDGEYMILLHGFIKKSQNTPQNELKTALTRLGNYKRGKL